jgi:hypothetical protein
VRKPAFLLACAALPALGCIEDRLQVDVTTHVHADGSCTRRVEYRLERRDRDKNVEIPHSEDSLRLLHRFPSGGRWAVSDEVTPLRHSVRAEASLASPNDLDWDYWRQRAKTAAPARNYVSFAMSSDDFPVYEYSETFLDPVSPLAGTRLLAQIVARKEDDFADRVRDALGAMTPRRADVRRIYREQFAQPLTREVERLVARPVYGPREKKELDELLERLDAMSNDVKTALVQASPAAQPSELEERLKALLDEFGEAVDADFKATGQLSLFDVIGSPEKIRFRVTLVMPAAITRANACVQGDTAVWEFDQHDLYGRGFEMWARAGGR